MCHHGHKILNDFLSVTKAIDKIDRQYKILSSVCSNTATSTNTKGIPKGNRDRSVRINVRNDEKQIQKIKMPG